MASPAHGSRSGSERLPPAILRLFAPLDEDPRLEGKGLAAAFAAAFPDLPDEVYAFCTAMSVFTRVLRSPDVSSVDRGRPESLLRAVKQDLLAAGQRPVRISD